MKNRSRLRFFHAACSYLLFVGLAQAGQIVETVSSGPAAAFVPFGNAGPEHVASPAQIAPKETFTAAELAQGRAFRSEPLSASRPVLLAPPPLQLNFEGTAQTQGLRPPDTHGAVGATQFVEVTNSKFEVFNKTTGAKLKSVTLNSFCGYTKQTIFDPRVVYDKVWNRWIVLAEAFKEAAPSTIQLICLAISTSSDATGGFFLYRFNAPRGGATNFYDYPMLGMDQDAIIVTANIFNSSDSYVFTNMFAIAKHDVYNGRGFSVPVFSAGTSGTLAPPIVETNDRTAILVASPAGGASIGIYKANNLGRSGASLGSRINVPVPGFSAPPDALQFRVADRLDVLPRFQDHSTQIDFHVLNVRTVGVNNQPVVRWWQINGNTNTRVATGTFKESSASHDFNPAIAGSKVGGIASNPIGRMFVTWTATQVNIITGPGRAFVDHDASVKASGRLRTDPLNVVGGTTLFTSSFGYNPSGGAVERWGDYSSVTLDPTPAGRCGFGNRAYIVNEKINSGTTWGSRFGRIGFC